MTEPTLSAKLDALLDPLNSIQHDLEAALALARRMHLPGSYIATIGNAIIDVAGVWENMNDIATVLDPQRGTLKL